MARSHPCRKAAVSAPPRGRLAFTLIELLVVLTIIGIMMSILMPVLKSARETARRVHCASNLHQSYLLLDVYAYENKQVYPHGNYGNMHVFGQGYQILPYDRSFESFTCPSNPLGLKAFWYGHQWNFHAITLMYTYIGGFGGLMNEATGEPTERPDGYMFNSTVPGGMPIISKDVSMDPTTDALIYDIAYEGRPHSAWIPEYYEWEPLGGTLDNHEGIGDTPAGENVNFVDGHIEWINWPGKYGKGVQNFYVETRW